jgi:transcriptional regulator with XRE-family HTH domain
MKAQSAPLPSTAGELIQSWRRRRRLSQLDLAVEAGVSQRHLSFVETGRAAPSRDMVLLLAEHLAVPARERNALLVAAGFAPSFRQRTLEDPELIPVRAAVDQILAGHEPHPALAIDRHWTLVSANRAVGRLLEGVDPAMMAPPVNVLRLSLHPSGLAARIVNFRDWRAHVVRRLQQQIELSADAGLEALLDEIRGYPTPPAARPPTARAETVLAGIAVPFVLTTSAGLLSFLSTTTIFGTAVDVTLSELAVESFFPADARTAAIMRGQEPPVGEPERPLLQTRAAP